MGIDESQRDAWLAMQATRGRSQRDLPLFGGGGGGISGGMDVVDAKVAAAEARVDTKFAELRGDLKDFATKTTVWGAIGTAIAAILGTLLAVLAFAGDRFDAGVSAGSAIAPYVEQQRARDAAQDKKLDEILRRLPPPATARNARP